MNTKDNLRNSLGRLPQLLAARSFSRFAGEVYPELETGTFHTAYYSVLEAFARGECPRLIVTVPPQHGKSLGSSILLPAYLLGIDPGARLCVASYALSLASHFCREVQRVITGEPYERIFPRTRLRSNARPGEGAGFIQTADQFEIVGRGGGMKTVGREGSLTGNRVDILIMDDLYKDAMEGNSPVVRDNVWNWYTAVARTRLHNASRELIVTTRWNEDDIVGRIAERHTVRQLRSLDDICNADTSDPGLWFHLNLEAIKESKPTPLDPRRKGEALWPERHSPELLLSRQRLDEYTFACMYQGNPAPAEGLLYGGQFRTYEELPRMVKLSNYTDTADKGSDYLCSVCYGTSADGTIYVTDVVYTQQGMEDTEPLVAAMLEQNRTRTARIESNNGGRSFAREMKRRVKSVNVEWFHQSGNKEARILTGASAVKQNIVMPADWNMRWPEFYRDVVNYNRNFRANRHNDAADVLTGIMETELTNGSKIRSVHFSGP